MNRVVYFVAISTLLNLVSCKPRFLETRNLEVHKAHNKHTGPQLKAVKVRPTEQSEILKDIKNKYMTREELKQHMSEILRKENPMLTNSMKSFCNKVDKKFIHWGWSRSFCRHFKWHHVRNSVNGDPLMWVAYGDEDEHKKNPKDTTLIMCGIHGDEITPIKFCYDILYHLEAMEHELVEGHEIFKDKMVIVAPIVNPDSFFKRRPSRTNARGVDVNRNFPTKDWYKDAIRLWKKRYRSDKRRFPGKKPLSEPETVYQVNLIKRYKPNKIISVHAPLTLLDYDGPEAEHSETHAGASELLIQMSEKAQGYKIKNYPFFPGSLGNWAGNERGIPTYTLELPTSDNRKHKKYWKQFQAAIESAIFKSL